MTGGAALLLTLALAGCTLPLGLSGPVLPTPGCWRLTLRSSESVWLLATPGG